ncbi:hypothetical protein D3C71_2208630 [compost metagenome]
MLITGGIECSYEKTAQFLAKGVGLPAIKRFAREAISPLKLTQYSLEGIFLRRYVGRVVYRDVHGIHGRVRAIGR